MQAGESDARGIVDGDMDKLPAGPVRAHQTGPGDAVSRPPETGKLLDIQVQQVARLSVFIPSNRRGGLQLGKTIESLPLEMACNGAGCQL
ncbi:hypothetical protein AOA77_24305 [Pseudomonas paraeruginosa]|nr:hypothetical protein AN920_22000 [Pseudomonas paraeruginosa]KQB29471.1 hypothetical protein AOA77_24305 [Pseudomonas paraeruginosa]